MVFLPVPEYRPDVAYLKSDYSGEVTNVFAADGFYIPCADFKRMTGLNIPHKTYGAIGVRTLENQILVFIGTAKNLWVLRDTTVGFENVSKLYNENAPLEEIETPEFLYRYKSVNGKSVYQEEAGPYHASEEYRWSFTVFGTLVIATNGIDEPQVFDFGPTSISDKFRDLGRGMVNPDFNPDNPIGPGNLPFIVGPWNEEAWGPKPDPWSDEGSEGINLPPRGRTIKNWGNFVAIMDVDGTTAEGTGPNTVFWSGLNNADWWTPGYQSCDYQTFYDGGRVVGSSEATNPIVFLQRAIYSATFVPGSDIIFSFQKIHERRGLKSSLSLASRGSLSFFADEGGFFQINGEGGITPIGLEKVDRTYFEAIRSQNLSQIMAAIDPFYSRIYWAIDKKGQGIFDTLLVYDWDLLKWTTINVKVAALVPIYSFGVTLEGLDWFCREDESLPPCNNEGGCEIPSGGTTPYNPAHIENLPYSLDSKVWQAGAPILLGLGIDEDTKEAYVGAFNGDNMEATVVSQEIGPTNRQMMRIDGVMPVVDNQNVAISVGRRNIANLATSINWTAERYMSTNTGYVHVRSRARYHRFKIRIDAGQEWSNMTGIDVTPIPAGMR